MWNGQGLSFLGLDCFPTPGGEGSHYFKIITKKINKSRFLIHGMEFQKNSNH